MQLSKFSANAIVIPKSLQLRLPIVATNQNTLNCSKILTASQRKVYETDEKNFKCLHFTNIYLAVKGEGVYWWHNNTFAKFYEEPQNS